jgi:hypothetical protein
MKKEVRYLRVSKKQRCPVCGKSDNCKVSEDGALAYCRRVSAGGVKEGRDGGWIHVLIEEELQQKRVAPKPTPAAVETATVKRSADDLDEVYAAFLKQLVLSFEHEAELKSRGLIGVDIHLHSYRSMPTAVYAKEICRRLAQNFDLRNIPGFYFRNFAWHFVDYFNATGYLVPIRNSEHKTVALQLRRDDDAKPKYMMISSADKPRGASSGTPPHFAFLGIPGARSSFREIIVTEGALKANIIAAYAEIPTVGLVGVGCFDDNLPNLLKSAFPNLEKISVAFDMDARTNIAVKKQRDRLVLTLEKINLRTEILSWNPVYKGFDDYLVNKANQHRKAA